ncbi:AAA family ATPase [Streptomyces sp. NPDC048639]|uniref:helix-turn-helix transcriptional regulator n=1 Tax=Streptomyces sp. NPDC048639 TaxID=3365581 RepID=UPI00371A4BF8
MAGTTDHESAQPATALVEREEPWSCLEKDLADAMAGCGRTALVTGPVAVGKTELLHAFADHAVRSGATFLKAVCSRSESALPFGVVGQLFRTLELPGECADDVAALLETGAAVTADSAAGPEAGEHSVARILNALCLAMLDLAEDRTVLIGVEDVRHADLPSLSWLLSLIRRLGSARVLLVLTETAGPGTARTPLHTELLRHPHCRRITLVPLSERGVATVFAGLPASGTPDRPAASAYRVSGGNPLLVRALLEDGHAADIAGDIPVGPNFRQALMSCLDRCEPAVLPVARALAVLDEPPMAPGAVGRLIGADAETVAAAIATMNDAGLLDQGRFRHAQARSAVLDDMPTGERKSLYLRAAALLHGDGAPAADVAPYVVMADAEDASMAPVLEEAAEHALRDERIDLAVQYLELAHRCSTDARQKAATGVTLVRAESRTNPAAAARRLPALVAALRAGHLADRDITALIVPLIWHGRDDDAADVLERARRAEHEEGGQAAAELRATELWLTCSHPRLARHVQPPAGAVKRRSGLVDPTVGPLLTASAALSRVLTQDAAERAVTDAEHVLQAARLSDSTSWGLEPALLALHALIYADRLDIAQPWCDQLLDEARAKGTAVGQAMVAAARAEIALRRGELATAYDQAETALTLMHPTAWGVAVGLPRGCLISAATRMGRHDKAAAHLEQPVPPGMFRTRYGLHYLHARGQYYLATGRHHAALADFLSSGELMSEWGIDTPGLVPWRTSAAEAWLLHGGHSDEAERLITEQLARLGTGGHRTRGAALRLLAAAGDAHDRPHLLDQAVATLEDCGDQFELARALGDLSRAHRAMREHRRAWTVARRAWHVASVCHAAPLCEELLPSRTRPDSAGRNGGDVDPIASLTDAERRVAALAAVGYTNREIAGKLYITSSTIEQHLTRVYRKLNVKVRRDLPADLHSYLPRTA